MVLTRSNFDTNKRKKITLQVSQSDKVPRDNSFNRCPYRDPTNITLDSDSEPDLLDDMNQQDGAWGGADPPVGSQMFPSRETPLSINSFNSPSHFTSDEIRKIIEPQYLQRSTAVSAPTNTLSTNNAIASSILANALNLPSQQNAHSINMHHNVLPTLPPTQNLQNQRNSQRLSGFPPLEQESSSDRLYIALMNKLDTAFASLNANLQAVAQSQVASPPPVVATNPQVPQSSNNSRNLDVPQNFGQPTPGLPQNTGVSSAAEADPIARLERMVTGLANQVQILTERTSLNSLPTQANSSFNPSNYFGTHTPTYRTWPHKWKIKYDGDNNKLAIEFFLDQVSTLKESNDITWENVISSFPQFLEGEASKWFYRYRSARTDISWAMLRTDMITQFRGTDTEESLWCKMTNRKQGDRETFDKFYNSLLDIQDRVSRKFSEEEMIGILRNNIKFDIKKCLITFTTNSLSEFVNKCRLTDKLLYPQLYSENIPYNRRISEIESDLEQVSPNIEAFNVKRQQNAGNQQNPNYLANVQCWNCDLYGHNWRKCKEKRNIFCYYCGHKNVICNECPSCYSNFRLPKPTDHPPSAPPMNQ